MRFNPIAPFMDPAKRPRAIMSLGVGLLLFVATWALLLAGSSTYWFCTTPCHKVHADNTAAYNVSSHTKVACAECHNPVGANPFQITWLKLRKAPAYLSATLQGDFHLPLNEFSHVSLEMPDAQCLQCHNTDNRVYTPDVRLLINHDIHSDADIRCTTCHNRVSHPEEGIDQVVEGNIKHDDWLNMDGCFRCHDQDPVDENTPTGACEACHTPILKLLPGSHEEKNWYTLYGDSSAHAKSATVESATADAARKRWQTHLEDAGESHADLELHNAAGRLVPAAGVNSCYTCHKRAYCIACHGIDMPHQADFRTDHIEQGFAESRVCGRCHARSAQEAQGVGFCSACHHPESTPGGQWTVQHAGIVRKSGSDGCLKCHEDSQCTYCHVSGTARFRELGDEMWE